MIVYRNTKEAFINDALYDRVMVTKLIDLIEKRAGIRVGRSEQRSWEDSLKEMALVMMDPNIPATSDVAVEYRLPLTSKRIDFLISGHNQDREETVVIVELKGWEKADAVAGKDAIVRTALGGGIRETVHPSYQAFTYAEVLRDYSEAVETRDIQLIPCAYLYNCHRGDNQDLEAPQYLPYLNKAPMFMEGDVRSLSSFVSRNVKYGDVPEILNAIDMGKLRPSKQLQNEVANMLKGNPSFQLLDDQKIAYEEIQAASRSSQIDGQKRTIIVNGGPGTGKSVLAINLLVTLLNAQSKGSLAGQCVAYVSKNAAPRDVFAQRLTQSRTLKKTSVKALFMGSGQFVNSERNAYDTLIIDEAHRLNEKSGMFSNLGENQIKEMIEAARCSVFFIDESQRVTTRDIGSVDEIRKWAKHCGSAVTELTLASQFRCNGSDGYLAWLDDVLEIRQTANPTLEDLDYEVTVCDSPSELHQWVKEKNALPNKNARLLAGYCWNWISDGKNNTAVHDIQIGDWGISWNLASGSMGDYALSETSVNEAGCIHTCQGLEFDYAGVLIGPDLRYENGQLITDVNARARTDQSMKGIKKMMKEGPAKAQALADEIIRNTYRTLMSRGMKACAIYCVDPALNDYFKQRVKKIMEIDGLTA